MEMYDSGTCLTMHQPWASLLIKGIKVHEGRVWNSNFRGRLWIHSSSKAPDEDLINSEFYFYRRAGSKTLVLAGYKTSLFFGGSEVAGYKTSLFFVVPKWLFIKPYFFRKAEIYKRSFSRFGCL